MGVASIWLNFLALVKCFVDEAKESAQLQQTEILPEAFYNILMELGNIIPQMFLVVFLINCINNFGVSINRVPCITYYKEENEI
jgi:hypothetical protein